MKARVNAYAVYMDDGRDAFKVIVPATTEKEARNYVDGNGEVIAVKEVDIPLHVGKIADALLAAHFGRQEVDVVTRIINGYYKNII